MSNTIYIQNKYLDWYNSIISNAQNEIRIKNSGFYYESHHIIPKSFGGSDDELNLVLLTAKEHFICHHLLTKFTNESSMIRSFYMMSMINNSNIRITSIVYENSKIKYSNLISGKNNPNSDGKLSKKSWDESSKKRRQNQSNVMRKNNIKYKTKPKEIRHYDCSWCGSDIIKKEFTHHKPKDNYYCGAKCRNTLINKKRSGFW